jgi:hypothetical protein
MGRNLSIQFKAALLLVVFGLNTLVGFACAVGVDMGFNSAHHHDEVEAEVEVHKDGKVHDHKHESHSHSHKDKNGKDNCCKDSVVKLSLDDKSVPRSNTTIHPVFFTAFVAIYYNVDIVYPSQVTGSVKYFARNYHPPIEDIRIAIQSFQI